jgi:hypothetical protein
VSLAQVKDRVKAITLAPVEDLRRDSDLSGEGESEPEAQTWYGFQTRVVELDPARSLGGS